MVISGTHALDICMWCLEGKTPVEVYARSIDKVLGPLYKGIDATAGMIMFDDGSVYHLNISWALPVTWPGAVYQPRGRHRRHHRRAHHRRHPSRHRAGGVEAAVGGLQRPTRRGWSISWAAIRPATWRSANCAGRWREETDSLAQPRGARACRRAAATVAEAHRNLMLTKALDLSAKRKQPVKLPLNDDDFKAVA